MKIKKGIMKKDVKEENGQIILKKGDMVETYAIGEEIYIISCSAVEEIVVPKHIEEEYVEYQELKSKKRRKK